MTRRLITPLLFVLVTGCPGGADAPEQPEAGGRFELRHSEQGRLVSSRALATFCEADTSLTIVALAKGGAGGMAAKLPWPPQRAAADSLRLVRRLAAVGTATLGFRSLGDGVDSALVADSGSAALSSSGDAVTGTATAWITTSDTTVARLEARLADVPVVARCPGSVP